MEHLVLEEDSVSTVGVDQAVTLLREQQKTVFSQLKNLKVVLERLVDVNSVKVYDNFEKVPKSVLEDFGRKAELCAGGSVRVEAREKVSVVGVFFWGEGLCTNPFYDILKGVSLGGGIVFFRMYM